MRAAGHRVYLRHQDPPHVIRRIQDGSKSRLICRKCVPALWQRRRYLEEGACCCVRRCEMVMRENRTALGMKGLFVDERIYGAAAIDGRE